MEWNWLQEIILSFISTEKKLNQLINVDNWEGC